MRQRFDLTTAAPPTDHGEIKLICMSRRPVSLRAKVFCGVLAGVIVMAVSSAFDHRYDVAEAAGATQIVLAEAQAGVPEPTKMMRGVSGMASAEHDWVFEN